MKLSTTKHKINSRSNDPHLSLHRHRLIHNEWHNRINKSEIETQYENRTQPSQVLQALTYPRLFPNLDARKKPHP